MAKYKVFLEDQPTLVIEIDAESVNSDNMLVEFTKAEGGRFKKSWIRAKNIIAIIHEDMEV